MKFNKNENQETYIPVASRSSDANQAAEEDRLSAEDLTFDYEDFCRDIADQYGDDDYNTADFDDVPYEFPAENK